MRSLPVWTGEEIQREAKAKFAIDMNEWKARKAAQLEAAKAAKRRTACERVLERLVSELERAADAEATLHRAAYRRLGAAHRVRTEGGLAAAEHATREEVEGRDDAAHRGGALWRGAP